MSQIAESNKKRIETLLAEFDNMRNTNTINLTRMADILHEVNKIQVTKTSLMQYDAFMNIFF